MVKALPSSFRILVPLALTAALFGCGDADTAGVDAAVAEADAAVPFEAQFVWPVPAWIGANDRYNDGAVHSGSADFAVPYWTPVGAARGGTVSSARNSTIGGYLVYIDHEDGFQTLYSHLSEPPLVSEGDEVTAGQVIGYSGRTGNAFRNGAHVHFAIFQDGDRLVIPGIELGDWVDRGEPVPGSYGSLAVLSEPGPTAFEVDVISAAPVLASPAQDSERLGSVAAGERLTVIESSAGYYRASTQDGDGWIVHTVTRPIRSDLRSMRIIADNANVRTGPDTDYDLLGTIPNGDLVTTFERDGAWNRLLFGLPTVYGWTHETNIEPTKAFQTRIRTQSANVRSAPSIDADVVGQLGLVETVRVEETQEGWYQIRYDGDVAWVAGWLTQGPL